MAKLLAYTVTSNISKQEILEEVLRRLKMTEELNNGEDAFSLTYDYNTKRMYMIYSEEMVKKDPKMEEYMVEVQPDLSYLDNQIADIYQKLDIILKNIEIKNQ